ncbi:MAG: hypothetical protein J6X48_07875 [Lachnospiraceae bacterium]|nr:hypothetical protein [Lachnospiraceae bacterium]
MKKIFEFGNRVKARELIIFGLLALFTALCTVIGKSITENGYVAGDNQKSFFLIACGIALSVVYAVVYCILFKLICGVAEESSYGIVKATKTTFWILWLLMVLCRIPIFVALYPGVFGYDIGTQAIYAYGEGFSLYTLHHPPLHTMYVDLCIMIAEKFGLSVSTVMGVIQIPITSLWFSAFLTWLIKRRANKCITIVTAVFFYLDPYIEIFNLELTKEVWFGGTLLLTLMTLLDMSEDVEEFFGRKKNIIALIGEVVLCCLLRNNAIYAFILAIPIIILFYGKKGIKPGATFVLALVIVTVVNKGLFIGALGMKPGPSKEALSVPIQQVAGSVYYSQNSMSEEQLSKVNDYLSLDLIRETYNPFSADPMKDIFKEDLYQADKSAFWKTWASIFKGHKREYMESFLSTNVFYWFPFSGNVGGNPIDKAFPIGESDPNRSTLTRLCHMTANDELISRIPVINWFHSLGAPLFIMLFCLACLIREREKKNYIVVILPLLYLFTHLAGPVSNFRYIYPIFISYPLFGYLIMRKRKKEDH